MSIVIVRGPDRLHATPAPPASLPSPVMHGLAELACCAGKTIALRSCASERELLQTLTLCRRTQVELVLLDPGACSASPRLHALLAQQPLPYIEVHDDPPGQPEACLPDASGRRVGRAQGYGAHSYTLALSLALEHLGCSELDDVHVGT
ncbi:3-dehydroquinate dehydratase [Pseudoxanthomonas winnipegensis]|uniref:3-dehydroquinate dehydratase n=1 Tax=Pseudoxanthomonas winnipegensis TaxID=2480810 RepID=UPI002577432F|nr:3-dehydroquinate dehydratase [Pseudoxanthomonas winnipegensis]WJI15900.1 3-dehydroquinate dehydratase [Pseudoxanthomonas winnipegensis]